MSKAVLISIHPKWCELIASGEKTIEVRKTAPKIETPFKCYIYCTNGEPNLYKRLCEDDQFLVCTMNGTVIGEFVCDRVERVDVPFPAYMDQVDTQQLKAAHLSYREAHTYLGHRSGYGWHISDLVIYDYPKKLSDFRLYNTSAVIEHGLPMPTHEIKRPPQSWCYVKELS